jgi:hypothetical protein
VGEQSQSRRAHHNSLCKKWRVANPEKAKAIRRKWRLANLTKIRELQLLYKYNLTSKEWEQIFDTQGRVCAGCKRPPSDFKHTFAVDHDHSTHLIRGILCWKCNSLLPVRKNLKELLQNLLTYLADPPATKALGEARKANPIRRKKRKPKQ